MRSLLYPARNPGWLQKLVLWVLAMIGVVTIPIAHGYLVRIIRNVARGNEFLPTFSDWKQLYLDGLRVIGALCVLLLPMGVLFMVALFGTCWVQGQEVEGLRGLLASLGAQIVLRGVQGIYLLLVVVFCPVVYVCVSFSPKWYAGLNFALMKRMVAGNVLNYILMVLVAYAIVAMSYIGVFLLIVGVLFTWGYALMCTSHLYGIYLRGRLLESETAMAE